MLSKQLCLARGYRKPGSVNSSDWGRKFRMIMTSSSLKFQKWNNGSFQFSSIFSIRCLVHYHKSTNSTISTLAQQIKFRLHQRRSSQTSIGSGRSVTAKLSSCTIEAPNTRKLVWWAHGTSGVTTVSVSLIRSATSGSLLYLCLRDASIGISMWWIAASGCWMKKSANQRTNKEI